MGREQSALIWPKATMQYYTDTTQTRNQQGTICVKDQGSLSQPRGGARHQSSQYKGIRLLL